MKKISTSDGYLGKQFWSKDVKSIASNQYSAINYLSVDEDFLNALDIRIKKGRNFSKDYVSDTMANIILNERAVRELNLSEPVLGQKIIWNLDAETGEIVYKTVVEIVYDFNFSTLQTSIQPFAFVHNPKRQWNFVIKLHDEKVEQTIGRIKDVWDKNMSSRPFQYTFLDQSLDLLYLSETNFQQLFKYLTAIAIIIACLGLFGLSSLLIDLKAKEIAIRKVLGASIYRIAVKLAREYIGLVLISFLLSFPFSYV